jgi:predicted phosphodiesterase
LQTGLKNILNMRVLVYSDIHGNLPAFEGMLRHTGPCDQYICLGDLVNYGPWSNECVDLAMSLPNSVIIRGNHEEAFIAGSYPGDNVLVKQFFAVTHIDFKRQKEIQTFLNEYVLGNFICTHTILNRYIYPDTSVELDADYMIGHSHHQFKYLSNGHILYNAGSVGQNRKLINTSSYLLYNTETADVAMENVVYDLDLLISEMKARNYPKETIDYYLNKERA